MSVLIDRVSPAAWDAHVAASPHGHYMQSYAWGSFQAQSGWVPHYLASASGDRLDASALLLSRTIPLTGRRVFAMPRGPVINDHRHAQRFLADVKQYVRDHGGIFARLDPYAEEGDGVLNSIVSGGATHVPREWSYWNAPKFVLWLDLQTTEDALMKGMSSTCRNEVRSGYKKGAEFSLGTSSDLGDFYRLMVSTGQNKNVAVHDETYYHRLYESLVASCQPQLFVARFDGEMIATGMSLRMGNRAWLLYAASDRAHFKLRANRTIQWEMIKWAHSQGCVRYDFRGTATGDPPSPNDPGFGVYEFKKSFGPRFVRLAGYYDLVARPMLYRGLRYVEEDVLPTAYRAKLWLDERRAGHSADVVGASPSNPAVVAADENAHVSATPREPTVTTSVE